MKKIAKITFLGMGAMGFRMARQLLKSGHEVTVWNRTLKTAEALQKEGAILAMTPAEAAKNADFVISMVRDNEASRTVWLDETQGALSAMSKGAMAIESSTLTPDWVSVLSNQFAEAEIDFIDAPVAGSRPQAELSKLIYFVGGSEDNVKKVSDILSLMGCAIHHCGDVGTATTIKLAVNALFAVQVAAMAELLPLMDLAGIDKGKALDIIASTPICSPAVKLSGQAMNLGQFAPAFPIELVEKDLSYLGMMAQSYGSKSPMGKTAQELFKQAIELGFRADNITGIAQLY